jgi:presqualene diphosphate synthase
LASDIAIQQVENKSKALGSFAGFHVKTNMSVIEYLDSPIPERLVPGAVTNLLCHKNNATALSHLAADRSFFCAIKLLPPQRREAMQALYTFCREVEGIARGAASRSSKQTLLSNWRNEIAHLYADQSQQTVTRGLSEAVRRYGLRRGDFFSIIDGMEMDARKEIRAPSFAELNRYCELVAVALGRLSMRIFGEETPAGERVAAELGRALQLTDILHDLAEDAAWHRLYLPRELLHAHGIFATIPSWVLAQPALPNVCRDLAALAEGHYAAAAEAIAACPRWKMRPAVVILGIYRALLHELIARGWGTWTNPYKSLPGASCRSWFTTVWPDAEQPDLNRVI